MQEVLRTNDPVLISRVRAAFDEARLGFMVADQYTSIIEGSIGAIQQRILVVDEDVQIAKRILEELGIRDI